MSQTTFEVIAVLSLRARETCLFVEKRRYCYLRNSHGPDNEVASLLRHYHEKANAGFQAAKRELHRIKVQNDVWEKLREELRQSLRQELQQIVRERR